MDYNYGYNIETNSLSEFYVNNDFNSRENRNLSYSEVISHLRGRVSKASYSGTSNKIRKKRKSLLKIIDSIV